MYARFLHAQQSRHSQRDAAASSVKSHNTERKTMQRTIRISVLTMLLICPAYAGEIQNGSPAPPPPTINGGEEPITNGEMQGGATDELTEVALNLLASVLPIL